MIRGRLLVIAVVTGLVFSAAALSMAAGNLTVGDFAVMVASRVSPNSPQLTPAAAAEILKKNGIRVPTELSSPLTEAEVVDLFSQFGITIQAAHPSNQMDRSKAQALVGTFGDTLEARSSGANVKTSSQGKTSALTSVTLESDLTPCQDLPRTKDCHTCCKALGYANKVCGQACSGGPKASAYEPTP